MNSCATIEQRHHRSPVDPKSDVRRLKSIYVKEEATDAIRNVKAVLKSLQWTSTGVQTRDANHLNASDI
jgi:hypothetical protein